FANDGTCLPNPHPRFQHFTALPAVNDYQAMCSDPSPPCVGVSQEIRGTVDAEGNVLIPVDWLGVLDLRDPVPNVTFVGGGTSVEAFRGTGVPLHPPDASFLESFSPQGASMPNFFAPTPDRRNVSLAFSASTDTSRSVLRILRRGSTRLACIGG